MTRCMTLLDADKLERFLEKGIIEVAPLAFMRGRTLNDSFVILDEAQNTHQRADEDVFDAAGIQFEGRDYRGHHTQIDLPSGKRAG